MRPAGRFPRIAGSPRRTAALVAACDVVDSKAWPSRWHQTWADFAGRGLEQGNAWESETLGTADRIYARHIALTINDNPVVLARSITTQGAGMNALTGLHTRPLAELLFEDPLWQRDRAIQYLRLTDQIPGRSCYWHHQQLAAGLIVQEFFLPNLIAAIGV